ncbi:MAG: type II toxin-antitoxin system RelE/ParE family toxin [Pseudomonadota bacterium]|nr:type II toxin-antitoxin system RelE/ParE family toxin [Pseudomonadota bacterium]
MKLVWTNRAKNDLADVASYIWADNPAAARKIRSRIERVAVYPESQPFMGRMGAVAGTREAIPHPSCRIVYQVTGETVFILRVVHTARRWPPVEDED